MDPSSELLQLLREIRNDQHELLALNREWQQQAERQQLSWRQAQFEYEGRVLREQEAMARADAVNVMLLRENNPKGRLGTLVLLVFMLLCGGVLGLVVATCWPSW